MKSLFAYAITTRTALRRMVAVIVLALGTAALADPAPTYCAPGERFAPDGLIVELGTRYFRICGGRGDGFPYNLDLKRAVLGVRIAAKNSLALKIEAETDAPKFLWGHMTFRRDFFETALDSRRLFSDKNHGSIHFGEAEYLVFSDSKVISDPLKKGSLPDNAIFLFRQPESSDTPSHWVACDGDPSTEPRLEYDCNIILKYLEGDTLTIRHRLLWAPIFEGPPMDFERLPDLVRSIHALFEYMDVTDRLLEVGHIPIVSVYAAP